jgi:superfamily I DNA and/or RNA helicase
MLFRALGDLSNVIAGTVHRVQGQEADVAIYDPAAPTARFVREQPMAGILLNVAASRAKRAFVISAEPAALAANPLFEPFIRVATPLR